MEIITPWTKIADDSRALLAEITKMSMWNEGEVGEAAQALAALVERIDSNVRASNVDEVVMYLMQSADAEENGDVAEKDYWRGYAGCVADIHGLEMDECVKAYEASRIAAMREP